VSHGEPNGQVFKPFFMRQAGAGAARLPQLAQLSDSDPAADLGSPAPQGPVYRGIPASAAYICKGGDCRYYMDS
jgi:hypothetical protein